jgi:hypothetical protein
MNTLRGLLIRLLLGFALAKYAAQASVPACIDKPSAGDWPEGEFGADLDYLRQFYTPPQSAGESNHYIDIWDGRKIRQRITAAGLTNNHALFVNSHGKRIPTSTGPRYAFYPHESLVPTGQKMPYFSPADLALIVGSAQAAKIHNILIAGCNAEGSFRPAELRKYFINATNVTYMIGGELGYQPMFLQAVLSHSSDVRALYETSRTNELGEVEYRLRNTPAPKATRLSPYVAALFRPRDTKPFSTRIAGREILQPPPAARKSSIVSMGR